MTATQIFIVALIGAGSAAFASTLTAVGALISARANAAIITRKLTEVASTQARKAEEVKQSLAISTLKTDHKLDEVAKIAGATHVLVNSGSLVQLRLYAVAARRIASLTNELADIEAATLADTLVREHEEKQSVVDQSTSSEN